jgi:hypothetical protein
MQIKIHGGLGNQLFQLCFAYNFVKRQRVVLDYGFYNTKMTYQREAYKLTSFDEVKISEYKPPNVITRLHNRFRKSKFAHLTYPLNIKFGNIIKEDMNKGFQRNILMRSNENILFDGYWCDFRYLQKGLASVKTELLKNLKEFSEVQFTDIAMHIRRGDYANIKRKDGLSNILSIEYYEKVLNVLKGILGLNLFIRVYSDDYEWAILELPRIFPSHRFDFSPSTLNDLDSLWSMSQHNYLIGANSTYSLWAYYLNQENIVWSSFPKEWRDSIENKGYLLTLPEIHKNVKFIYEK